MEIDLARLGDAGGPPGQRRFAPVSRRGFLVALLLVFLFLVFFFLNFQTVVVEGESMLPTFKPGQRILVSKALWLVGSIREGDIVVIKTGAPGEYLVKRVYKIEGEEVDYRYQPEGWDFTQGPYVVPKGHIYVLGDNEETSEDSRIFGAVPLSRVLGKAVERERGR